MDIPYIKKGGIIILKAQRYFKKLGVLTLLLLIFAMNSILIEAEEKKEIGDYEILFQFSHLDWVFDDSEEEKLFNDNKYWRKAMPVGFKTDSLGNYYLSVRRWGKEIPATLNKIVMVDGKALLEPYPSREMNKAGDPNALQFVLGYEIDDYGKMWILDKGSIKGVTPTYNHQKIVVWDIIEDKLVETIRVPESIAPLESSFLNDISVDTENGYIYITDSGNKANLLQPAIIVYNMNTKEFRRVLHKDVSTMDADGYWFEINGKKIFEDSPMKIGVDGISLSSDKKTLYFTPLTSKILYSIDSSILQDYTIDEEKISQSVKIIGDKGTNTEALTSDNQHRIWYTMISGNGIGYYDKNTDTMNEFITDERMQWIDSLQLDNKGYILFGNNHINNIYIKDINWSDKNNIIFWKAYVGEDTKSYLYRELKEIYTIKPGDVLWKIARDYNTTWKDLSYINNLENPDIIYAGDKLIIRH